MVKYCSILIDIILSCPRAHIHIPLWHQWKLSNSLFAGPCGNTVSELFWVKIRFFFCRAIFNLEQLIGSTQPHENSCAGTTVGWEHTAGREDEDRNCWCSSEGKKTASCIPSACHGRGQAWLHTSDLSQPQKLGSQEGIGTLRGLPCLPPAS